MNIYWIFLTIILFCIYVLFGLHITESLETVSQQLLTWVIYTILWGSFINIFTLGYFWSVIREKTGPYGLRGQEGEIGKEGIQGECSINASQAYCMKSINDYINELYKTKNNKDILNEETQRFPCVYLNEKVIKMSGSRQFQVIVANLSNDNKGIDSIVNYLKSIWLIWFDLLYNSTSEPGVWFEDEYGDENNNWVGTNPFDEIKKYDVYYWGITSNFRPLKAEICRTTSTYKNSKLPQQNLPEAPRLKIIETNNYEWVSNDAGSRAYYDATWYRPIKQTYENETYYPVGDIVIQQQDSIEYGIKKESNTQVGNSSWLSQNNGPDMKTILVSGDVKDPILTLNENGVINTELLDWVDANNWFGSYKLTCPEGYTDMGNITRSIYHETYTKNLNDYNLKCVPKDCVEPIVNKGKGIWEHNNQWQFVINDYKENVPPSGLNGYNLFRTASSGQPFYKIKDKCLNKTINNPPSTKEVEKEFGDLGIGWHGHPYKLDPKYSIFSFLNLVPEGMIINKGTGQRFYIVHYGGEDVNIFNVLTYNKNTNKYNNALQINTNYKEKFNDSKEKFNDSKNKVSKEKFNDNHTFIISNKDGKNISYDIKTNTLALNKGKELIFDIKNTINDKDIYYNIITIYYSDNNKKIKLNNNNNNNSNSNSNNSNSNNSNNSNNTILNDTKMKWRFMDNEDGSLKLYNDNNKYLGYNKIKDEIELVDTNDINSCYWYLNKL